jgi:hypothetical protein
VAEQQASSIASGMAAQLIAMKGLSARAERSWMKRLSTSLPVPVGPLISTGMSLAAMRRPASTESVSDRPPPGCRPAGAGDQCGERPFASPIVVSQRWRPLGPRTIELRSPEARSARANCTVRPSVDGGGKRFGPVEKEDRASRFDRSEHGIGTLHQRHVRRLSLRWDWPKPLICCVPDSFILPRLNHADGRVFSRKRQRVR